jgi:hypothetical protein
VEPPAVLAAACADCDDALAVGKNFLGKQDKIRSLDNNTEQEATQENSRKSVWRLVRFVPFDCLFADRHVLIIQ